MNRYLAVSHILSLLEQSLAPAAFGASVATNPLFASACTTQQRFLELLRDEGLLAPAQDKLQLSDEGRLLQRQVLNWTARDKESIQARTAAQRALTGEQPLDPRCPTCGSDFCGLYLFVILIERLWAGLPERRAWGETEPALLAAVLGQLEAEPLFLIDETEPLASLLPTGEQALEQMLAAAAAHLDPGLIAAFREAGRQRLRLPPIPHVSAVPRLRFEQALIEPGLLNRLRRLAYPQLFPKADAEPGSGLSPDMGCVVRLSRPGHFGGRALVFVRVAGSQGHQDRLWLLVEDDSAAGWTLEGYFDAAS